MILTIYVLIITVGKREEILMAAPTMLIIILDLLFGRDHNHSHQAGKDEGIIEGVPIM